jgi:hypothetical protein
MVAVVLAAAVSIGEVFLAVEDLIAGESREVAASIGVASAAAEASTAAELVVVPAGSTVVPVQDSTGVASAAVLIAGQREPEDGIVATLARPPRAAD